MIRPMRTTLFQRQQPRNQSSESRKISFTSLSKNKNQNIIMSKNNYRTCPAPVPTANDDKQNNFRNNFNNGDEYRLFSNMVRNNESRGKLLSSKVSVHSPVFQSRMTEPAPSEYYGILSPRNKMPRPESKHKIQKCFSQAPALIRPKNNSSRDKITLGRQQVSPSKKNPPNCNTFPPNEYYTNTYEPPNLDPRTSFEQVNTSKASIKFDMSPCFNL